MKNNTPTTFIVVLILGLLLVSCQGSGEVSEQPAATPDSSSETNLSTESVFDPAMHANADTAGLVYENLLKIQDGQVSPVLALGGTVSDDGLDYILSLRPGVTFHDGTALNADAVIANFDRWFDPDNGIAAWATNFGGFKGETTEDGKSKSRYDGIEKVDELTVLVHLNEPDAEFLNKLADPAFAIVSTGALASSNFGSEAAGDGGTGPYAVGAWSDTGLTLEPFADYWNPNAIPESSMDIFFE